MMKYFLLFVFAGLAALGLANEIREERELITGGTPAAAGRYPYMAGLMETAYSRPYCGGVLVTPTIVYSAAHCSAPGYVSVGCVNVDDDCARVAVQDTLVHPDFSDSFFQITNDFRLVVLETAVTGYSPIAYVADEGWSGLPEGTGVHSIGWGKTSDSGDVSDDLLEVYSDTISQITCAAMLAGSEFSISDSAICTGGVPFGPCEGDEGGPLLIRCDETGEDVLVGIYSWNIMCGSLEYPNVFGRVSFADDWFKETLLILGQIDAIQSPPPITDMCGI